MVRNRFALRLLRLLGRQDWIRYGIRDRTIRLFCDPGRVESCEFEVDFFDLKYRGNLRSYLDWVVYFYGAYEKQELFLLRDLVTHKGDSVFVDIGANVGQHSVFMSRYCKNVHAFEPYEPVRTELMQRIRHNEIRNILVHELAIGERDEELDFFAPRGANRGTGSFFASHATDNNECIGKLPVVKGDAYFERAGIERVDLMKIDVEGFEKSVLKGLGGTLRRWRPALFMEFSEETRRTFGEQRELIGLLPENYTIHVVTTNRAFAVVLNRAGYRLTRFDFDTPGGNILLQPADRQAARRTSFST